MKLISSSFSIFLEGVVSSFFFWGMIVLRSGVLLIFHSWVLLGGFSNSGSRQVSSRGDGKDADARAFEYDTSVLRGPRGINHKQAFVFPN